MTLQQRLQAAYELIKRVQRTEPIRYMCNDSVPIDLEGTMELPVIPERELVTAYLDDKHVDRDFLQSHLYSMLQDFFETLQKEDYEGLEKFTEARFVDRLRSKRQDAPGSDWFGFQRGEYDEALVVTVDKLLVKGVGIDRDTNDDQIDYQKVTGLESEGMRQFIHKYDFGMQDYYYILRN